MVLINTAIHGHKLCNARLNSYLERIQLLLPKFGYIKFYHILRSLNVEVDNVANQGVTLSIGSLKTMKWGEESQSVP